MLEGDQAYLPAGALSISLDPDESSGTMMRPGIAWFAKMAFFAEQPTDDGGVRRTLDSYREAGMKHLVESPLFADVDFDDERSASTVPERLRDLSDDSPERWAFLQARSAHRALEALDRSNADEAARETYFAVSAHAMHVYSVHLEEVVWQGYRAERVRRIRSLLKTWDLHAANGEERFWQDLLFSNEFALSQLFAAPMVLHRGQAYVGGKAFDNRGGQLTDFLLRNEFTGSVVLVEIKTPVAPLLQATAYRTGVFPPSSDIAGAVAQALTQRDTLVKSYYTVAQGRDPGWRPFDPPLYVIAGDSRQLDTSDKQRSFDLYRNALSGVTIVTFDELFSRLEKLLTLPGLSAANVAEANPEPE